MQGFFLSKLPRWEWIKARAKLGIKPQETLHASFHPTVFSQFQDKWNQMEQKEGKSKTEERSFYSQLITDKIIDH